MDDLGLVGPIAVVDVFVDRLVDLQRRDEDPPSFWYVVIPEFIYELGRPQSVVPKINADYPEKAPLATVPPLILRRLPTLPDGLEYRFMRRDLILRDSKANLIVDFVHEAVPTIGR